MSDKPAQENLVDTYTESMRGVASAAPAPKREEKTYDVDSSSMRGFTSGGQPALKR